MKINTIICLLICLLSMAAFAQPKGNKLSNKELEKALAPIFELVDKNDYNKAIESLNKLKETNTDDPELNFLLAKSYLALGKYEAANESVVEVLRTKWRDDPELYLVAGKIFQSLNEFEEAEEYYLKFKLNAKGALASESDVDKRLAQVTYSKQNYNRQRKVTQVGISKNINTEADEYAPALSADGKSLAFTRKMVTQDGEMQEDIFFSTFNDELKDWGVAKPLSDRINTSENESVLSISPNGKELFFYRYDRNGGGDIYTSTYNEKLNDWGEPSLLPDPINTEDYEGSISITSDGKYAYFVSDRADSDNKGKNIYKVKRAGKSEWGEPEYLGIEVNTDGDEIFVYVTPDGKTLFVASDGRGGFGGFDIYRYDLPAGKGGKKSEIFNIGSPINTGADESTFCFSGDLKTMLVANERSGGMGLRDIYAVDLSAYPIASAKDGEIITGTFKGTIVNEAGGMVYNSLVEVFDDAGKKIQEIDAKSGEFEANLYLGGIFTIKVMCEKFNGSEVKVKMLPSMSGDDVLIRQTITLKATGKISTLDEQKGSAIEKP